jgi:hypothetical protein
VAPAGAAASSSTGTTFRRAEPKPTLGERLRHEFGLPQHSPIRYSNESLTISRPLCALGVAVIAIVGMLLGALLMAGANWAVDRTSTIRTQDMVGEWDLRDLPGRIRIEPDPHRRLRVVATTGEDVNPQDSTFFDVTPTGARTLTGWTMIFRNGRQVRKQAVTLSLTEDRKVCCITSKPSDESSREPPTVSVMVRRK